ncbi:mitochondrial carrier domain-containing protein [Kickxella alabastrina]|uniref:mitochondrial carrier domain-containing protein n=1 Tax=Kickxella alabastrina TaxID=61397 RepID=UPI002221260D|nr:mitochondrial carrier domain-containing protein [Kickxella alabastrina]KAI7825950.1 mitochondrial carrier domain-containing protein [Kickxella alabastrina]
MASLTVESKANLATATKPSSSEVVEIRLQSKIISACTGAVITSLLMTPFDVVKTRQQSRTLRLASLCVDVDKGFFSSSSNGSSGSAWRQVYREVVAAPPQAMTLAMRGVQQQQHVVGTVAGMRHIAETEGARTLWRGLAPTLVASGPSTVIYFVGYDYLRQYLGRRIQRSSWHEYEKYSALLAGCLARTAAVTAISPIELVRTRMQSAATHDFKTVMRGVSSNIRASGIHTLWRGLVPTLWRDVPFSAIYWFGYERWRDVYAPLLKAAEPAGGGSGSGSGRDILVAFCSGASSGVVAAALTTPFDVAKTRRQIEQHADAQAHRRHRRSLAQVMRQIAAVDGLRGLFAGLAPRLMKVAPSCAIMISAYEFGKQVLK